MLVVAAVDQSTRVEPVERVDVTPVVDDVAAEARAGDLVVYAPATVGDLVRHEVGGAEVVGLSRGAADAPRAPRAGCSWSGRSATPTTPRGTASSP